MVSVAGAASIASYFSGAASSASSFLTSVQSAITAIEDFVNSITSSISGVFDEIGNALDWIEGRIDAINTKTDNMLDKIGGTDWLPDWAAPGKKAEGGPVKANTPYIVGEKGPELFVPNASGTIETNAALMRMSRDDANKRLMENMRPVEPKSPKSIENEAMGQKGQTFNMTFNLSGITDRTDKRALAKEIAVLIQQESRLTMGTGKARGRYL